MPINSKILLDRMTIGLFSLSIIFLFCGLFIVPSGTSYMSTLIVLSCFFGVANFFTGDKTSVGLRDKRLLFAFLAYALVILVNRQIHGDASWIMRNILYVIVFSFLLPRERIIINIGVLSVIMGGISIGGLSVWQYYHGLDRVEGYTNAILFSQAALVMFILNMMVVFSCQRIYVSFLASVAVLGSLYALYQSQSRGVWIAAVFIIMIVSFVKLKHKPIKLSLLILAFIISMMLLYQYSPVVQQRILDATSDLDKMQGNSYDTSWGLRLMAWKSAWFGFLEHPIFGIGYDGLDDLRLEQLKSGIVDQFYINYGMYHAHNQFMQNILIRGMFGGAAAILVLIYPIVIARRPFGIFSASTLVPIGILICSLSDVPLEHQNTLYIYTLSLVLGWFYYENAHLLEGVNSEEGISEK
ncbi:O-antigen ligase family protein [Aeromonas taiwanensis]|uniref:O-antigen ligase family protein n=1 Tax=Aeromonas taiwanensis TaxID=633417 RepID=UPI00207C3670|nr:O-antigen ligase family protein [Aeromonas taiwanensis]MCO4205730.1 O-antigen ligase family protein [Aeromonas taiwanensis]